MSLCVQTHHIPSNSCVHCMCQQASLKSNIWAAMSLITNTVSYLSKNPADNFTNKINALVDFFILKYTILSQTVDIIELPVFSQPPVNKILIFVRMSEQTNTCTCNTKYKMQLGVTSHYKSYKNQGAKLSINDGPPEKEKKSQLASLNQNMKTFLWWFNEIKPQENMSSESCQW